MEADFQVSMGRDGQGADQGADPKNPGDQVGLASGFTGIHELSVRAKYAGRGSDSEDSRSIGVGYGSAETGLFPVCSHPSFDPGWDRPYLRETEHELSHFSSMLPAVGVGALQGFKLVDLVVFDYRISANYPTGKFYFVRHGILLCKRKNEQ